MASTSDLIEFLLNTGYGDIPSEAIQKTIKGDPAPKQHLQWAWLLDMVTSHCA